MRICPKCSRPTLTHVIAVKSAVCLSPLCTYKKKIKSYKVFQKKFRVQEILPKVVIIREAKPPTEEIPLAARLYSILSEESFLQGLFDQTRDTAIYDELSQKDQCLFRSAARYVLVNYDPKGLK